MKFISKRDWWITLIMAIVSIYSVLMAYLVSAPIYTRYVLLSVAGLNIWIYYFTYYILKEDYLIIRCGPIKVHIHYEDIKYVQKTRSLISSMALSMDRIKIKSNKKGINIIYISPLNKVEFLSELENRCSNLIIKD